MTKHADPIADRQAAEAAAQAAYLTDSEKAWNAYLQTCREAFKRAVDVVAELEKTYLERVSQVRGEELRPAAEDAAAELEEDQAAAAEAEAER